ncbi:hypothetical protein PV11_04244 [Exophiala sideris]|uniref:Uncharacterized protein n=1 Tax=Exophiala sideris TaxID=1016849 RepID=A0A0D1YM19_9EURO|nr:hypothetical protein PV11_04244 [Exophiala sideris]
MTIWWLFDAAKAPFGKRRLVSAEAPVQKRRLANAKTLVRKKAFVNVRANLVNLENMSLDLKLQHISERQSHDDQLRVSAQHGPAMTILRHGLTRIQGEVGAKLES